MPKVSIIMPCYNSAMFIPLAIESVLNQTFEDWELIITDDGSTDNSVEISRSYQLFDDRIKIYSNIFEKGAPGARNTSLHFSNGRYIAFLDSDDIWLCNKLELQLNFMVQNGVHFSFSYHDTIDENNNFIKSYKAPHMVNLSSMKLSNFIPCLTVMYDTSRLGKVEQPNIKKRNDFALWLTILGNSDVKYAYCLPIVTAKYRVNDYGLSSSRFDTIYYYRKCLKDFGNVSPFQSFIYTFMYISLWLIKTKFTAIYNSIVLRM